MGLGAYLLLGALPANSETLSVAGQVFTDCRDCPEMVVVPAGKFLMGSPRDEVERSHDESPLHEVKIAKPFAAGRFTVTFKEWDACLADGGCGGYRPGDEGWGREDRPVIRVSWNDAKSYVQWLSRKTGKHYRLLTEAEWEYIARAGTTTPFWWGTWINPDQANYNARSVYHGGGQRGEFRGKTVPVKSFDPNPWGFYQLYGNVWEWVEDCWNINHQGAPEDGSARETGEDNCNSRMARGGSWYSSPWFLRSAHRLARAIGTRDSEMGFRVARTLEP
jgi:formylglycine-generating enzyme required for sulfatase activity